MNPCDICGEKAGLSIPEISGSFACVSCGFVHVKERRSPEEIAHAWDDVWGENYTSQWPGVIARQTYVAEFCDQAFGWKGKTVLDVGAGEGTFLSMILDRAALCTAVEPSPENWIKLDRFPVNRFQGALEEFDTPEKFDVITLLWTLENTGDCMKILRKCHSMLMPDGLIVVATGSRILVPYKKPFHTYVSDLPPDLHCFRFSLNSLRAALGYAGFSTLEVNDVAQNDAMVAIGEKGDSFEFIYLDDPQKVLAYFRNWKEAFP